LGELRTGVGDDVVVKITGRAQRVRDVVSRRAGILTRDATVAGGHVVGRHEVAATAGGQRYWISIDIGLAVWVRGPGGQPFVDGELVSIVGDNVVIQSRE